MQERGGFVKGIAIAAEGTETRLVNPGREPNRKWAIDFRSYT